MRYRVDNTEGKESKVLRKPKTEIIRIVCVCKPTPKMADENESASAERGETSLTLEEVVNVTVQAMNARDQRQFGASDMKTLIPEFNGDGDVGQWFARINAVKQSNRVGDDIILLVLTSKLQGRAKKWFDSRPECVTYQLDQLQIAVTQMFKCKEDKLTLMRKFEKRRWQRQEKFAGYYYDKILMGNKLGIADSDMIGYLIGGFDDRNLQTQAKMKEFTSLEKMLVIMNNITPAERCHGNATRKPGASSAVPFVKTNSNNQVSRKCYNCNEVGHLADSCPKPKRERGSCFKCGKADHQVKNCPMQEGNRAKPDSTIMFIEHKKVVPAYTVDAHLTTQSSAIAGVIDTGSPISLISKELLSDNKISPDSFVGFNQSPLNIIVL